MNQKKQKPQKVLLIIRDGWGYSPDIEYNMIAQADTPYTDMLEKNYPTTFLSASGEEVGLPEGYFGNSEVGHMTIGAGRPLEQSLLRINNAIADKSFFENPIFLNALSVIKNQQSKLHLIALLQDEGVHAHVNHLLALLELAHQQGLKKDDVYIHIITDGRDTGEQEALKNIHDLQLKIHHIGVGKIVSIAGRYYAMDRNNNWERIQRYYSMLHADAPQYKSIDSFFKEYYMDTESSDEFIIPHVAQDFEGLQKTDVVVFVNFRKDRARQLTQVFLDSHFIHFKRPFFGIHFVSMTEYYKSIEHVAFPDIYVTDTLGEILEKHNKTQLRISETEKYAHVTYFFDGGADKDLEGSTQIMIPSPDVPTFDLKPEMASVQITESLIMELEHENYDFVLCNFPNADMVGHTGDHEATKRGVEAVDRSLEKIIPVALEHGYVVIVAADHGNAEYKTGIHETSHTANKIPCTIISKENKYVIKNDHKFGLKNIASTILFLLNIQNKSYYYSDSLI